MSAGVRNEQIFTNLAYQQSLVGPLYSGNFVVTGGLSTTTSLPWYATVVGGVCTLVIGNDSGDQIIQNTTGSTIVAQNIILSGLPTNLLPYDNGTSSNITVRGLMQGTDNNNIGEFNALCYYIISATNITIGRFTEFVDEAFNPWIAGDYRGFATIVATYPIQN